MLLISVTQNSLLFLLGMTVKMETPADSGNGKNPLKFKGSRRSNHVKHMKRKMQLYF